MVRLRTRLWPIPVLAFVAWFVGLVPWVVTRSTTGTFGTPFNPRNDLREALLPFHYQRLPLLLVVTVMAGALAGSAPWWFRGRLRRRWTLALLTTVGAAAATIWAVRQTLGPQPDLGGWERDVNVVQLAFIAFAVATSLLGLVLGLAVSLGGPVLRTVTASVLIVVGADWLGQVIVAATRGPALSWLPPMLSLLAGAAVGVLLAVLGVRPRWRLLAWLGASLLVVLTAAALTASRYVLEGLRGTPMHADAVAELVVDGLEIFWRSTASTTTALVPASPLTAVLVALVVGAVGVALVERVRGARAAPASVGTVASTTSGPS